LKERYGGEMLASAELYQPEGVELPVNPSKESASVMVRPAHKVPNGIVKRLPAIIARCAP
jgi:hypothetical protein